MLNGMVCPDAGCKTISYFTFKRSLVRNQYAPPKKIRLRGDAESYLFMLRISNVSGVKAFVLGSLFLWRGG